MQRTWMLTIAGLVLALVAPAIVPAPVAAQPTRAHRDQAQRILEQAREQAVQQVLDASRSDEAALRAHAIEALQSLPQRARPIAQLGVDDNNPAVRFSALVTVGELQMEGLGPAARQIAQDPEEHPSVRAAGLYAARRCGEEVDLSPMAELLGSPDPSVRANAAMLLGMLGDPSAIKMLKELAHAPMPRASLVRVALVRIQIAEALVRLGDESALDAIRAGAYSAHDEVRVLAVQTLGKLDDRRMEAAYEQIMRAENPIELRLAGAEALARVGREVELAVLREGVEWDKPAVRAQAAFTLGLIKRPEAARMLTTLLETDEHVQARLAAAAAILRAVGPPEAEQDGGGES